MRKKRLVKEGNQYWDPDTGCIYSLEGELIAHDCVLRNYDLPKLNFSEYVIIEDDSKYAQTEEKSEIEDESKVKTLNG